MTIDTIACEPQFIDHSAPVWLALPADRRGRFIVPGPLADRARRHGIEPALIDVDALRASSPPPVARREPGPLAFVTSIGDTKVGRRMGYRRFVFMEHGAGQAYLAGGGIPHPSYAGGMDREDTVLFLVPNDYSAALWRKAYPDAAVEVVGSPRLDALPARQSGPGPVVALSFHWPGFTAPEAGTALGHYIGEFRSLAKRYSVIGHAHPKGDWPARMRRNYDRAGIEFVPDFDDVCRRADVYVCDNSSTIFEFASTGRPVVVLNGPEYRRRVHHGLRFWEAATVGVQVDEPKALAAGIDRALERRTDDVAARERALALVYAFRTGGAQRAADAVVGHLDG